MSFDNSFCNKNTYKIILKQLILSTNKKINIGQSITLNFLIILPASKWELEEIVVILHTVQSLEFTVL